MKLDLVKRRSAQELRARDAKIQEKLTYELRKMLIPAIQSLVDYMDLEKLNNLEALVQQKGKIADYERGLHDQTDKILDRIIRAVNFDNGDSDT